jgi:hypothetical protein
LDFLQIVSWLYRFDTIWVHFWQDDFVGDGVLISSPQGTNPQNINVFWHYYKQSPMFNSKVLPGSIHLFGVLE